MALVISRFPNEGFWIGENVRVVVASVKGKKVSLAVTAPREIDIDRDEVRERKIAKATSCSTENKPAVPTITPTGNSANETPNK